MKWIFIPNTGTQVSYPHRSVGGSVPSERRRLVLGSCSVVTDCPSSKPVYLRLHTSRKSLIRTAPLECNNNNDWRITSTSPRQYYVTEWMIGSFNIVTSGTKILLIILDFLMISKLRFCKFLSRKLVTIRNTQRKNNMVFAPSVVDL
jgi:hypothetical protein